MALPGAADFERVVLPHLDAAHNLARWLVGDAVLAEDITQDAVLRALAYFRSYRGGDARAWLLRVVRNTAYSALAARRWDSMASLDGGAGPKDEGDAAALQVPDPADDPEAALAHRDALVRLDRALAGLPTELRECLTLRELEGLSYKEIAHVTEVPIGTVMSRLWRARQALEAGRPARSPQKALLPAVRRMTDRDRCTPPPPRRHDALPVSRSNIRSAVKHNTPELIVE